MYLKSAVFGIAISAKAVIKDDILLPKTQDFLNKDSFQERENSSFYFGEIGSRGAREQGEALEIGEE
jgi:hypothetical protein|nr:hypothetical protein [Nostoc punctiforme]